MITREDIQNAWGYSWVIWTWSRKNFYILDKHNLYLWRKPEAKDFIKKVNVKVLWVISWRIKEKWPLWLKCKINTWNYIFRDETEIYKTFEEVENTKEFKEYIWNFNKNQISTLEKNNKDREYSIKREYKRIEENNKKIELLKNL